MSNASAAIQHYSVSDACHKCDESLQNVAALPDLPVRCLASILGLCLFALRGFLERRCLTPMLGCFVWVQLLAALGHLQ